MLKSSKIEGIQGSRECLPYDITGHCPNIKKNVPCFGTGDIRANQNFLLLAFQQLFLREHNRIAQELAAILTIKTDEALFQVFYIK